MHFFENCLSDHAATWWAGKDFADIDVAIRSFKAKYWSDTHQTELSRKLHSGEYKSDNGETMSEYLAIMHQQNSFLDAPMSDKIFVVTIAGHFPIRVRSRLHIVTGTSVDELAEQLDNLEFEEKREKEKEKQIIVLRPTNTTPDAPIRQNAVSARQPRTNFQRLSSPGPMMQTRALSPARKARISTYRYPIKRAATSGNVKSTSPAKKVTSSSPKKVTNSKPNPPKPKGESQERRQKPKEENAKSHAEVTNKRQASRKSSEKMNAAYAINSTKNAPASSSGYDSDVSSKAESEEPAVSNNSKANIRKGKKKGKGKEDRIEREVSAFIRSDKRFYTKARLIKEKTAWPIEVSWDSGATSSLIREDILESFREIVESDNKGVKLQSIKIKQQEFAGAFAKSSAKANRMVQLDLRLPQTDGRTITVRHKFFVINKMNKPLVVGQDMLMKHLAFTKPSSDGKTGTLTLRFDPENLDIVALDASDHPNEEKTKQHDRKESSAQRVTHPREDSRFQEKESRHGNAKETTTSLRNSSSERFVPHRKKKNAKKKEAREQSAECNKRASRLKKSAKIPPKVPTENEELPSLRSIRRSIRRSIKFSRNTRNCLTVNWD